MQELSTSVICDMVAYTCARAQTPGATPMHTQVKIGQMVPKWALAGAQLVRLGFSGLPLWKGPSNAWQPEEQRGTKMGHIK